jgi:hypothetical protein
MGLASVRDVAIIMLALQSLIVGGLLAVLIWQVWKLVKMLETEIKPMLDSADETAKTVRGTTTFISENVVDPVIRVHSTIAGIKGGIKAAFGASSSRASSPRADEETASDESRAPEV